jgi:serine protease
MSQSLRTLVIGVLSAAGFALILLSPHLKAQEPQSEQFPALSTERGQARLQASTDGLSYVPGDILVKFRAGAGTAARTRALSVMRMGADAPEATYVGEALLVHSSAEPNPEALAMILRRQPEVEWAQPNYIDRLHSIPNDPGFSAQWNLELMNLPKAWDINPGGNGDVLVAVVDTGANTASETPSFRLWTSSRFENVSFPFVANPEVPTPRVVQGRDFTFLSGPVRDLIGHGTHVAGTVLQETNNGVGVAGIAYNARLLPLKACYGFWDLQIALGAVGISGFIHPASGGCETADVVAAIRYAADSGAKVINVSIGGPSPSPIYLDALRYAVNQGAFVAISAGNSAEEGNPVYYPAAYAAQIDGVMAVGAVGASGKRAFYSNTGPYVEIAAPGGSEREGQLAMVYQTAVCESDYDPYRTLRPRFDRYCNVAGQGTSMAAPHVAGVAALLYSQGITNPAAIEAAIKRFAKDLGAPGRDNEYGFGLIDARATLLGLGVAR